MTSKRTILVCGKDSTFQYLSQQLEVMGYSSTNVSANPLDITFECLTTKPTAVFLSSNIEQPTKLIGNLRKAKPSPFIFIIKSHKDVIPNKQLEELSDQIFYQPLDINLISNELSARIKGKENPLHENVQFPMIHNHISDILNRLCVTPNYNGYMYLREAIKMAVCEPINSRGFSTKIYPKIAEEFGVSPASVERNIRTAIIKSWERTTASIKAEMFGLFTANTQWRPTNSEFILIIADLINRRYLTNLKAANH